MRWAFMGPRLSASHYSDFISALQEYLNSKRDRNRMGESWKAFILSELALFVCTSFSVKVTFLVLEWGSQAPTPKGGVF